MLFTDVMTNLTTIAMAFGLVGNILAFIIFSRKSLKNTSIGIYARAILFLDCFIIFPFLENLLEIITGYNFASFSLIMCKIHTFSVTGIFAMPGWLQCAFSLDILVGVANIPKLNFLKSKKTQLIIIATVVLVESLVYLPTFIWGGFIYIPYGNNITIQLCDISSLSYWQVYNLISFVQILGQFAIMTLISIAILRMLAKSRQIVEASMGRELRQRRSRDIKFSVTCLTLNILFGVLRVPILIAYFLYQSGVPIDLNGLYFTILLFYIDFSIGFMVYFISNKMFRNELLTLFRLSTSSSGSTAGGNTKTKSQVAPIQAIA